ncbi:hypothetical protein BN1723_003830 [Verticillium longisporum]|uniref:Uncharacterized protein n=1 Tax=Verticillium longisporum TaxID=100787 RepID=A0A0G4MCY0_VERLO|nr:hypothetical protein BN1723_003830 [Verticillium longisporum]
MTIFRPAITQFLSVISSYLETNKDMTGHCDVEHIIREEEEAITGEKRDRGPMPRNYEGQQCELAIKGGHFHWLLAVECYQVKNIASKRHQLATQIDKDATLFVSATP